MLKVRFPNGQCITYNNANHVLRHSQGYCDLYEEENEVGWIAQVPLTCIVENVNPCKVENPIINLTLDKAFDMVQIAIENQEDGYAGYLVDYKRLLKNFNASTWDWN